MSYVAPLTGTAPVSAFPARSLIPVELDSLSWSVPEPLPVDAVTVRVAPLPVTPVIAGGPARPVEASVKFAAAPPFIGSLKLTVQDRDAALVGVPEARVIVIAPVVGAVVSNMYASPVIGKVPARSLLATSLIVPLLVMLRPIEPVLLPVVP